MRPHRPWALIGALGAFIFCTCATTETANVRRAAEYRLKICLERAGQNSIAREICKQESFAYCLEHMPPNHIEKGCALGAQLGPYW